jgi:PPM family protein phosphatase
VKDWSIDDTHPLSPAETGPVAPHPRPDRPGPAAGPSTTAIRIDVAGLSDKGKTRNENQDHFLVMRTGRYSQTLATSLPAGEVPEHSEEQGLLMMVADGMGGQAAGEVASRTVLVTLTNLILDNPEWILKVDEGSASDLLHRTITRYKALDTALAERMEADPALDGMGTTLTVAYSLGLDLFIAHVGDSRAYVLHDGAMRQLTRDHTHVQKLVDAGMLSREEAAGHQLRNVLTNVLGGAHRSVEVEFQRLRLAGGDQLLLCSDGLTGTAKDEEIAGVLAGSTSANDSCRRLVELALERGAPDNVTAIVARYEVP